MRTFDRRHARYSKTYLSLFYLCSRETASFFRRGRLYLFDIKCRIYYNSGELINNKSYQLQKIPIFGYGKPKKNKKEVYYKHAKKTHSTFDYNALFCPVR